MLLPFVCKRSKAAIIPRLAFVMENHKLYEMVSINKNVFKVLFGSLCVQYKRNPQHHRFQRYMYAAEMRLLVPKLLTLRKQLFGLSTRDIRQQTIQPFWLRDVCQRCRSGNRSKVIASKRHVSQKVSHRW